MTPMKLHGTSHINEKGHLTIGGCDTVELAAQFGTPLYVLDEQLIRERCRAYVAAFRQANVDFQVAYASKAMSTLAICRLIEEEGLALDVVSDGELYTALQAGFPPERIHFHGNNKSLAELTLALDANIGGIVVDNFTELHMLRTLASERQQHVHILLRLSPGVEAHTHAYIQTGQEDSKFGFDLASGQAAKAVEICQRSPEISLLGFHSHIGSQIFDVQGYRMTIRKLAQFSQECYESYGHVSEVVNIGGGFGIHYCEGDQPLTAERYIEAIVAEVRASFTHQPLPAIWIEPGRSIVGEAGTTLYRVGTEKRIPGIRHYVAVDGGMADNPRPALYQAKYAALVANKAGKPATQTVSIAGKCCESGDMLIWDVALPDLAQGDVLAVLSTGAYNYSMASNYNRLRRPAAVLVNDGNADVIVQRETLADLTRHDVIPARLQKPTAVSPEVADDASVCAR